MQMKNQKQKQTGYSSPEFQMYSFSCQSVLCTSQQEAQSIEVITELDTYNW